MSFDDEPKPVDLASIPQIVEAHEEVGEHPDERWLVSYADMMTLLFGLFVMLYSMANKFDQVQKSASQEFAKVETDPKVEIKKSELEKLKEQLQKLQTESTQNQSELTAAKVQTLELKKVIDEQKIKIAQDESRLAKTAEQPDPDMAKRKIVELEQEQKEAEQKIEEMNRKNQLLKRELASVQAKPDDPTVNAETQKQLQITADQLRTENAKLQRQLEAQKDLAKTGGGPFAAVVISWPTQNHDIDLIVTDPEGKSFNYKHRQYETHPGKFILDTRRGPGAEMWQTDRLLAGVYEIKYVFYNTYGNEEPAPVAGSIYSQGGIFDLPAVKLNFKTKREQVYKIKISEKGNVQVLP